MTAAKRMSKSRTLLLLSLLALAFLFVSCAPPRAADESPATTPAPSVDVTTEPQPTVATEAEADATFAEAGAASAQADAASLVDAWIRERNRYDESVRIEVEEETSVVTLPGLSLYRATPLIPDMLSSRCAVYDQTAWCSREALENIVSRLALGSEPGQLDDEEWLALVAFFTGADPLAGPHDLNRLDKYIPDDERAKISAPVIDRLEPGGIEITFYYEVVDIAAFPVGPLVLLKKEVAITGDNEVTIQDREVWVSPEDLWLTPDPE